MAVDPRANSPEKIVPPAPLPMVSRRALGRVKDWMAPPTACPYCGGSVRLVNNSEIYRGKSYGEWPYAYHCKPCDAMVGLHPFTDLPLGTMADKELREARKEAKSLWQSIQRENSWSRNQAYDWLAKQMKIPKQECHFGHFDLDRANEAFAICDKYIFG